MRTKRLGRIAARGQSHVRRVLAERLESRIVMDAGLWSGDSLLNLPVEGTQSTGPQQQSTTLLADGRGMVVYAGKGEGTPSGLFVRGVDATGQGTGSARRVDPADGGRIHNASITTLTDGQVVVAWSGKGEQDRWGVFVRTLSPHGEPISPARQVNQTRAGIQTVPVIAATTDGGFVVAWSGRGKEDFQGVFYRRFDRTATPTGAESAIATRPHRLQTSPSLVATDDGGFVAAWSESAGWADTDVFLRRFDSAGTSDPIRANETKIGRQVAPQLATLPGGQLLMVWSGRGADDASGVFVRTFLPSGQPASGQVRANVQQGGLQFGGSVATADDGSFLILWHEFGHEGSWRTVIKGRHFRDVSHPDVDEFVLPDASSGQQYSPSVTGDGKGGYLATWTGRVRGERDVFVSRLAPPMSDDQDPPTLSVRLTDDTGANDSDGQTSSLDLAGSVVDASGISTLTVYLGGNPVDVTSSLDRETGQFVIRDAELRQWSVLPIEDGELTLSFTAEDNAGNVSAPVDLILELDTQPPAPFTVGLDPDSDDGVLGDQRTATTNVAIVGQAEPGATAIWGSHQVTVDSGGRFRFGGLAIAPGEGDYDVAIEDVAGNRATQSLTLFGEASLSLSESVFDSHASIVLPIPSGATAPWLGFDLETTLDHTALGLASKDTINVSIVDPADPSSPLLTRNDGTTSIFSVSESAVSFDQGLSNFNGRTVQIDLTSLADRDEIALVVSWINADSDFGSTAKLTAIAIDERIVSSTSLPFPSAPAPRPVGPEVDLASYLPAPSIDAAMSEVHLDVATGLYRGSLSLRANDVDSGRRIVVAFPGLPDGVELLTASGTDDSGVPYVNFMPAVPWGGLGKDARSATIGLTFANPLAQPLHLLPQVLSVGPNQAPTVHDPGPLIVDVGGYLEADFSATDADGDHATYTIRSEGGLPTARLSPTGVMTITPAPGQQGTYHFDVIVSDSRAETVLPVELTVSEDPLSSTRLSGWVLDTSGAPLVGVPIELGDDSTVTDDTGHFELVVSAGSTADTLLVRGERLMSGPTYPFIAEKIPLLIGRDLFRGSKNEIGRPIYLPALDVASGQAIDPDEDTVVTTATIPGASVFVKAGSLTDQDGLPFEGILSITEVPADLTPAALPDGLFTDLVVTIQPGEMVFQTPAPLTLPNRAGHAPGTELILWSISPITGDFDNVGTGRVNADGTLVETISGGIRNSSWHDFSTTEPDVAPPEENDNNSDDDCDDCEDRHDPESGGPNFDPLSDTSGRTLAPREDASDAPDSPLSTPTPTFGSNPFRLTRGGSNGFASWGTPLAQEGAEDSVHTPFTSKSTSGEVSGPFFTSRDARGRRPVATSWSMSGRPEHSSGVDTPLTRDEGSQVSVSTHAGALHQSHTTAAYRSLDSARAVRLVYDSERADPRPLIHAEVRDPGRTLASPVLVSSLTVFGGAEDHRLADPSGSEDRLALPPIETAEQYRAIPAGQETAGTVHQVGQLAAYPSGRYEFANRLRISGAERLAVAGLTTEVRSKLVHVNGISSRFGSGWGIAGLKRLVRNYDDSILMIDGDGGELVFERVAGSLDQYQAPGDFSTLFDVGDGTFRYVTVDQTVSTFDTDLRLQSIADRNGNTTSFRYGIDGRLLEIEDPVGLVTEFEYAVGQVSAIVDPVGRRTMLHHDVAGNLIRIVDADLSAREFDYDENHRITGERDKNGNTQSIEYDLAGRVNRFVRADGSTIDYAAAQTRNFVPAELTAEPSSAPPAVNLGHEAISSIADANGNVTTTHLDRAGQTIREADASGWLPSVLRAPNNRVTQWTDGRGNVTDMDYDDRGNLVFLADSLSAGTAPSAAFLNRVYRTGDLPTDVVTGDFDGDGNLDVAVAAPGEGIVAIHQGRGDGTLGSRFDLAADDSPLLAVGDFDADAIDDLVVVTSGGSLSISPGREDRRYESSVAQSLGSSPTAIRVGDFDGDGRNDLIALLSDSSEFVVMHGSPGGTLVDGSRHGIAPDATGLATGDFDSDGRLDVAITHASETNNLSLHRQVAAGGFATTSSLTIGTSDLRSVEMRDVNRDDHLDLLFTDGVTGIWASTGRGDGTFDSETSTAFSDPLSPTDLGIANRLITVVDVDGDGHLDVIAAQPLGGNFQTFVGDGTGTFSAGESVAIRGELPSLAIADVDSDGRHDVIAVSRDGGFVRVAIGSDAGTFSEPDVGGGILPGLDAPADAIHAADIDGNGTDDLILLNRFDESISVVRTDGLAGFEETQTFSTEVPPSGLSLEDVDDDGNVDFLVPSQASDQLWVLFGDGSIGGDGAQQTFSTIDDPTLAAAGDIDGDTLTDLIVTGDGQVQVLRGIGSREFLPLPAQSLTADADHLAVGDLNGDGRDDLAMAILVASGTSLSLRYGQPDGSLSPATLISVSESADEALGDLQLFDLDGDTNLDLLAVDATSDNLYAWIADGSGSFSAPVITPTGSRPGPFSVRDFNRDGVADVVVTSRDDAMAGVMFGTGDGRFIDRQDYYLTANPIGVAVADPTGSDTPNLYSVGRDRFRLVSVSARPASDTALAGARRFEYDPIFSQLTRAIDELGNQTIIDIDPANGNRLSVTRVFGEVGGDDDLVESYTYNARGQVASVTDPLGRVTEYDYDAWGRLAQTTFAVGTPDQAVRRMEYDAAGNVTAQIDELGLRTEFEYDALNRTTRVTDPDPDGAGPLPKPYRTFAYDSHGQLARVADNLTGRLTYTYDAEHRLLTTTDVDNETWTLTYDDAGNLLDSTDRLGRTTTYSYDDRHRLVGRLDADRTLEQYRYDTDDNRVRLIDKRGNAWVTQFDARNRVTGEIDPLGHRSTFEYDGANQLIAASDELSRVTEFAYDDAYRLVTITQPDPDGALGPESSPLQTFEYDAVGNQLRRTDALGNGVTTSYDFRNRPITERYADPDAEGPLEAPLFRFTYDVAGRLTQVVDPIERVTTYLYDDLHRLVETRLPDPDRAGPAGIPVERVVYDAVGNTVATVDPLGNTTTFSYDDQYRLSSRLAPDPDGVGPLAAPLTRFLYDAEGQLTSIIDPLSRTVAYAYDPMGRRLRETYPDPDGDGPAASPVVVNAYDAIGNLIRTTDPLGNAIQFDYDDHHRLISTTGADPDGDEGPSLPPVSTIFYDAADQAIASVDPLGRVTTQQYDQLGRVILVTLPDPDGDGSQTSPQTSYRYDAVGNLVSSTDALARTTDYVFDHLYRRTEVSLPDPDGESGPQTRPTTRVDYDAVHRAVAVTDPLGRVTRWVRDDLDRVTDEIYPDPDGAGPLTPPKMTFSFDLVGNETSMTDAVGGVTSYTFDDLYRRIAIEHPDPDGPAGPANSPRISFTFDVAGQHRSTTDASGRTSTFHYDALGRVVSVVEPDPDGDGPLPAATTSHEFDLVGNRVASVDPLGRRTEFAFDNLYRRLSETGPDIDGDAGPLGRPTTRWGYDLLGNLISLTDPVGNTTRWEHDRLDRLVRESIDVAGEELARTYSYDVIGNRVRTADRNGRATEYVHDRLNRLVAERWLGPAGETINTIEATYDEANQLLSIEDTLAASRTTYAYDDLGRVTESAIDNGGRPLSIATTYDAQSRRVAQELFVGSSLDHRDTFGYDALHRLTERRQSGPVAADKRFDFGYNPSGQLVSVERFADWEGTDLIASTAYRHDGQGRLDAIDHVDQSGAALAGYRFTYDVASRITEIDSLSDGESSYDYDGDDQLLTATHSSQPDEMYRYDENGNRLGESHETGDHNRLASDDRYSYEYDAEGNRIRRTDQLSGAIVEYEWDHRNRLVTVVERATESGAVEHQVRHRYDAHDRWISRAVDADGDGPLSADLTRYDYDGSQIVVRRDESGEVTDRYSWGVMVDQILSEEQSEGGTVLYPLTDHLGSVRDLLDREGSVVNHIRYDSYGGIADESDAAIESLFGYTGKPFDESTGLQNNHHRWFDAHSGSWISEDPIGHTAGDPNLHRYVGNRPTDAIDPNGLVLVAFDGTGNSKDMVDEGVPTKTNVRGFYERYNGDKLYKEGVGVRSWDFLGAGFGQGAKGKVKDATEKVKAYFEEDPSRERVIDVVGFSRGAAEAVQFTNDINDYAQANNIKIRFVGLFDTVFAMGLPNDFEPGYSTTVPPNIPTFHAMALNEHRKAFDVKRQATDTNDVFEVWFAGAHSNVGGGYADHGLSDISMQWMLDRAIQEGVPVTMGGLCENPDGLIRDSYDEFLRRFGFFRAIAPRGKTTRNVLVGDHIHESVFQSVKPNPYPGNLKNNTFTVR